MSRPPYVSFLVRSSRPDGRIGAAEVVDSVLRELGLGRLPAGSRLPPVRVLEQELGLSKNTVQAAYDELVARGALESREREGVFVAGARGESALPPPVPAPAMLALRPAPGLPPSTPRGLLPLSMVFIDPALLPREKLEECTRSVLRSPGVASLYEAQGYLPLRQAVAARLAARGMAVDASHVIITTGSQQAIDLVARATATPRVAVETPVYSHARLLFESLGLGLTGLPLDPFAGLDLEAWEALLTRDRPGFLYAITSYQNPTGYSYSTHELVRLCELSARLGFALVEDDWGSDMLSMGGYRPTLRQIGGEPVLYINSFTKKLLPSLRVGFLVAPPALVPTLVAFKRLSTLGNPWLTEAIVAEFLERGYYDAHLTSLHHELDARYALCLAALREILPSSVRHTTPGGGPTLWLEIPREVDLAQLQRSVISRGVHIELSAGHFQGPAHLHGFRIGYAYLAPDALRRALHRLAEALAEQGVR
jgi:GntR family transcriptional regulator/MocR family aminotransferase